jgi:hypothetical protein
MITVTRTATIAPGKLGDAMTFAHQVAKLIKDRHGTALEVLMPIGGNPSRVAWHARYDSVAQWEALNGKLLSDKEYMDLISKQTATFVPGSLNDEIWRSI